MASQGLGVGIDLGTASSSACVFHDGSVVPVSLGAKTLPSVVAVPTTSSDEVPHQVLVGGEALLRTGGRVPCIIRNAKRLAGRTLNAVQDHFVGAAEILSNDDCPDLPVLRANSVTYRPEEVLAIILRKLSSAVNAHPIFGQVDTMRVAISVPPYFDAAQRQAVKNAGTLAGLRRPSQPVCLINDTSATALSYAAQLDAARGIRTAVVVDAGYGGCSLSVVKASSQGVTVLSASNSRYSGGLDIDDLAMQSLHKVLEDKLGRSVHLSYRDEEALYSAWETAKFQLSGGDKATASVEAVLPSLGYNLKTQVSYEEFKSFCSVVTLSLITACRLTLQFAKVEKSDIQDVVLVGGCSNISLVRRVVAKHFEGAEIVPMDVDLSVATGAALFARCQLDLEDITALGFSYDLDTAFQQLVLPNEKLPCKREFFIKNTERLSKLSFSTVQSSGETPDQRNVTVAKHRVMLSSEQEQVRVEVLVGCDGIPEWHAPGEMLLTGGICNSLRQEELDSLSAASTEELSAAMEERKNLETFCCGVMSNDCLPQMRSPMMNFVMKDAGEALDWMKANSNLPAKEYVKRRNNLQSLLCAALDEQSAFQESENRLQGGSTLTIIASLDDPNSDEEWTSNETQDSMPSFLRPLVPLASLRPEDRQAMRSLLQQLHRRVLMPAPDPPSARINANVTPHLSGQLRLAFCNEVALQSLSEAFLSITMYEVRAAARMCLLIDTLICDACEEMVSFILRYVRPDTGEALERLVAVVPGAASVSSYSLLQHFTSLCSRYQVEWTDKLCGVSTDSSRITQVAFIEFVYLLQQKSEQELFVVYNGSHTLCELVCQAGECQSSPEFYETLAAFREFFSVRRRLDVLATKCGLIASDLVLQNSSDVISFVSNNFKAVLLSLCVLKKADPGSAFLARKLLSAMKGEFVNIAVLLNELFVGLRGMQPAVCFEGSTEWTVMDVRIALEQIKEADQFVALARPKIIEQLPPTQGAVAIETSSMLAAMNSAEETVRYYLKDCVCVFRDIETLHKYLELQEDLNDASELFNWLIDVCNKDVIRELELFRNDYVKRYGRAQPVPAAACLKRIMQMRNKLNLKQLYPTLLRCLEEVMTLPLVPARGNKRKLHLLRERLSASRPFVSREAELIILCATDSDSAAPPDFILDMTTDIIAKLSP